MALLGYALNTYRNRKEREEFAAFAALVASPAALPFVLPANATLAVSTSSVLAATDTLIAADGIDYGAPAGAANAKHAIGFFGRNTTIAKAAGAPGTVSVYVRDPAGALRLIAQG